MRFTRPEKSGYPDPHHIPGSATAPQHFAGVGNRVEDVLEFFFDLVGDNVFTNFGRQGGTVKNLDDAFHFDADVPLNEATYRCHSSVLRVESVIITARRV